MNKTTVEIDLGKNSYDIKIGSNLFEEKAFTKFLKHKEVMLIYDQNLDTKEINNIKRVTAKRLYNSWINIPHVTRFDEVDITEIDKTRLTLKKTSMQNSKY